MEYVYVLDHSYEDNGYDVVKQIGVFSTEELAEKAVDALISKPPLARASLLVPESLKRILARG